MGYFWSSTYTKGGICSADEWRGAGMTESDTQAVLAAETGVLLEGIDGFGYGMTCSRRSVFRGVTYVEEFSISGIGLG